MFRSIATVTLTAALAYPVHAQTVRLGTEKGYVVAHLTEKSVKAPYTDRSYHWVRAQSLHVTQGGIGGTLLHGIYQAYHPNGQLHEEGEFHRGLKHGVWKVWGENGLLTIIERWKCGRLHGITQRFSHQGELLEETRYRKGVPVTKKSGLDLKKLFSKKDRSKKKARVKDKGSGPETHDGDKKQPKARKAKEKKPGKLTRSERRKEKKRIKESKAEQGEDN